MGGGPSVSNKAFPAVPKYTNPNDPGANPRNVALMKELVEVVGRKEVETVRGN
jgi:hypothetical protein